MATLQETAHKTVHKTVHDGRDDVSDTASSQAEVMTLNDEDLPTYEDDASASARRPVADEKRGYGRDDTPTMTVDSPFHFPESDLPTYAAAGDIKKPIAIPQTSPIATAPFLDCYSPDLLAYGITEDSFFAFLTTLSAFVSAKVSQQALQHASDVASSIGSFHKDYANNVKRFVKNIGNSAKHFNPFGVVGGTIGLTVGAATHVIGSVFNAPISMLQKPQTPRQRALTYLAAANKDWFHARGLHALLLNTKELATNLGISVGAILDAGHELGDGSPEAVCRALRKWIAPISVRKQEQIEGGPESSNAAAKRLSQSQVQLADRTLWLLLVHDEGAL